MLSPRHRTRISVGVVALCAGLLLAPAAPLEALSSPPRASLELRPEPAAYRPGSELRLESWVRVEDGWHVNSHTPTYDYLIPTSVEIEAPPGWAPAAIEYPEGELQTFGFADEALSVYDGEFVIPARLAPPADADGEITLAVTLRYQACDDRSCLPPTSAEAALTLVPASADESGLGKAGAASETAPAERRRGLGTFLLFGLLGGLLLNAMPCVLPVLSLKLMGLVKSAAQERAAVIRGSLATTAGILVSFWALALAAILAKTAGAAVGWGIQFQQPTFVAVLALIVVLFCLNLWGLFEVPLPARLATWADSAGGEGLAGHFTAGLFATLLATPCSAPYLGPAVGFALAREPAEILAVFSAVGVGMALPYLLLALAPGSVRILPKPGPWMLHLKGFMGFLLAGAAVWLLYVLASQLSRERLAFIELALLAMALFLWARERIRRGSPWRVLALLGAGLSVAAAIGLAAGSAAPSPAEASRQEIVKRIPWIPFEQREAERLAAEGSFVFVDVTADWCFTCKVNERLVLETETIAAAFEKHGVVPMKADWTNRDDRIAAFLAEHGKYGIPFYLLYRPGGEHQLFSELLTKEALLAALPPTTGS